MDRLDEALTIARLMFTEERPSFEGQHYRIHEALNSPAAHPGRRPADPRGRWRRAADAADRGQVRGHDPLVRARARDPAPQGRAADPLLRGDRPGPGDDRADDRRAGDRVPTEAEAKAFVELPAAERRAARHRRHARAGRRRAGDRTSTPGSPASRSTTRSIGLPSRSRRSASSSAWFDQRLRPRSDPPIGPTLPAWPATRATPRGRAGSGGSAASSAGLRRSAGSRRRPARGCPPPSTSRAGDA